MLHHFINGSFVIRGLLTGHLGGNPLEREHSAEITGCQEQAHDKGGHGIADVQLGKAAEEKAENAENQAASAQYQGLGFQLLIHGIGGIAHLMLMIGDNSLFLPTEIGQADQNQHAGQQQGDDVMDQQGGQREILPDNCCSLP